MYAVIIDTTLHLCTTNTDAMSLSENGKFKIHDITEVQSNINIEIYDVTGRIIELLEKSHDKSISFIPDLTTFGGADEDDRNEYITEQLMDDGHCIDFYWKDGVSYEGYITKVELRRKNNKNNIVITGCLNRDGVSYEDKSSFNMCDINSNQKAEIYAFCKDWFEKNNKK